MSFALILALTQTVVAAAPDNDLSAERPSSARRSRRVQLGRGHDFGVRSDRLRWLARSVARALLRVGVVHLHRDVDRPAQSQRTDHAGHGRRLPRDLVRLPEDRVRIDADRLHGVRQRRVMARSQGTDLPDHGGRPSSAVTEDPDFSDKGGHGTIAISRSANEAHYSWVDPFT